MMIPQLDPPPENHIDIQQVSARQETILYTTSLLSVQELHNIVKNMRRNASSGPDGLNTAFYKNVWP
jgi:hypothetical protein